MGWNHIALVYNANLAISHVALCVLHVLAKTADETNQCYPSMSYIAEKMNMSVASVKRGVKELGEAGLVLWVSGRGNRHVNRYQINVDKLAKLINNRVCVSHLKEDKDSSIELCEPLNGSEGAIKQLTQTHGREHKENKKLVSMYPTQQDLFAQPVDNSPEKTVVLAGCASAQPLRRDYSRLTELRSDIKDAKSEKPDYKTLVKTYGWKPENKPDIEAVWSLVWQMGANREESDRFVRLNSARKWNGVGPTCSVKMLAHLWIDAWKKKDFEGWCDERNRRAQAKRAAEEAKLRAAVAASQK